MSTPKRYCVTGGAGFVGSHLCDRLIADGHDVLCLDNLSTGDYHNIDHLSANRAFQFYQHDVIMSTDLAEIGKLDGIFHLACPASPRHYQQDPINTTQTAVVGTLNMLSLAKQLDIPLLQASTSEVYGDPLVHPQTENDWGYVNPIGPRACYDEGKRCAESLCFDFHRQSGVQIKVARIFNTYGPRMRADDGRVISNFINQALNGESLSVYGDGQQTRSFCYVTDLVDGLVRLMATPAGITGPVNLGNPAEITVNQLVELVEKLTGSTVMTRQQPLPEDDPKRRCPDIRLANELLGWQPATSLETGLRRTIAEIVRE